MKSRRELQSGCFVIDRQDLELEQHGTLRWTQVIGKNDRSGALSLFFAEADPGTGPEIFPGDKEAVLYLVDGRCKLVICRKELEIGAGTGVHVRPGEHFSFVNESGEAAIWLIGICPQAKGLNFDGAISGEFDQRYPQRTVTSKGRELHASGDRFYKLLVGPSVGSESVTQFIGRIPLSKAPEHFHLYEEAICILSGHGRMWTGDQCAEVRPGSMIFLPRKQVHSLECRDEGGMELMGLFYPAGSPAINYEPEAR